MRVTKKESDVIRIVFDLK
ncbi:hypothetical protein [Candidatus Kinetoplastidibacterium blastocrithidiae]